MDVGISMDESTVVPGSEVNAPKDERVTLEVEGSNTAEVITLVTAGVGLTNVVNMSTARELELTPTRNEVMIELPINAGVGVGLISTVVSTSTVRDVMNVRD